MVEEVDKNSIEAFDRTISVCMRASTSVLVLAHVHRIEKVNSRFLCA